jgi:hypothetical protein
MPQLSPRRLLTASMMVACTVVGGCHSASTRPVSQSKVQVVKVSSPVEEAGAVAEVKVDRPKAPTEVKTEVKVEAKVEPKVEVRAEAKVEVPKSEVRTVAHEVVEAPRAPVVIPERKPELPPELPPPAPPVMELPEAPAAPLDAPPMPPIPPQAPITEEPGTSAAVVPVPSASPNDMGFQESCSHDEDFTWIRGEAQKSRQGWRLRYAGVDEMDPHGGCVTLAGEEHFAQLQDGQSYKVYGRLLPCDERTTAPLFHIDAVAPAGR